MTLKVKIKIIPVTVKTLSKIINKYVNLNTLKIRIISYTLS